MKRDPEDPLMLWRKASSGALFVVILIWFLMVPYR